MHTSSGVMQTLRDVVIPLICVLGMAGLLLTIVVLKRKNMTTSANCYLLGLTVADFLFLLLFLTRYAERLFEPDSPQLYLFHVYVTFSAIFMNVFVMASTWITVLLALERYVAICRPFLAANLLSVTRARVAISVIFVVCFLSRLPSFFAHVVLTVESPTHDGTNSTVSLTYVTYSDFGRSALYRRTNLYVCDIILSSVLPFLLLLILNALLIFTMHASTEYSIVPTSQSGVTSQRSSAARREELQVAAMLVSIVVVFFVCQAPYVVFHWVVLFRDVAQLNYFEQLHFVALLLMCVKSTLNFVLYCWFSEKFWMTLKQLFKVKGCSDALRAPMTCCRREVVSEQIAFKHTNGSTRVTLGET